MHPETRAYLDGMRSEIGNLRAELRDGIGGLRTERRGEVADLRAGMRTLDETVATTATGTRRHFAVVAEALPGDVRAVAGA